MADVIEIAELVGRASVTDKISMNSTPQQTEYKPIYSSLAIEQNTLDIYFCRINIYVTKERCINMNLEEVFPRASIEEKEYTIEKIERLLGDNNEVLLNLLIMVLPR